MSAKFGGPPNAQFPMEHGALAAGWACVGVNTVMAEVTSYRRICVPAQGVTQRHITTSYAQRRSHPNPDPQRERNGGYARALSHVGSHAM
jgi:hypothetical protein